MHEPGKLSPRDTSTALWVKKLISCDIIINSSEERYTIVEAQGMQPCPISTGLTFFTLSPILSYFHRLLFRLTHTVLTIASSVSTWYFFFVLLIMHACLIINSPFDSTKQRAQTLLILLHTSSIAFIDSIAQFNTNYSDSLLASELSCRKSSAPSGIEFNLLHVHGA